MVETLARPGGNVTGFAPIGAQLAGKRLELLKETIPELSRVAVLWDPQNAGSKEIWEESQRQAKELGLQLHSLRINSADELEGGFKDPVKAGSDALAWTAGALLSSVQKQTINLAAKNRLPTIYHRQSYVANGGLMSYGPDDVELVPARRYVCGQDIERRQACRSARRTADEVRVHHNLKAAKQIGPTIPPNVLVRADKVIK